MARAIVSSNCLFVLVLVLCGTVGGSVGATNLPVSAGSLQAARVAATPTCGSDRMGSFGGLAVICFMYGAGSTVGEKKNNERKLTTPLWGIWARLFQRCVGAVAFGRHVWGHGPPHMMRPSRR